MLRFLGWSAVALGGLLVLGVLVLLATGDGASSDMRDTLRRKVFEMAGGGRGFNDGALVWRETEPFRITIEELPSLDGRRLGSRYEGGLVADQMSLFGYSLRELVARCLSLKGDRVLGDASLDQRWFDVDAARVRGLSAPSVNDWEPIYERVLEALLQSYELTLEYGDEVRELTVLRAGPKWDEHLLSDQRSHRGSSITSGDGVLMLDNLPAERMVRKLEQRLGVLEVEGLDETALCSFALRWEPGDTDSLARALAEQLDLQLFTEERSVEVALVSGVPKSLHDDEPEPADEPEPLTADLLDKPLDDQG